MLFLKISDGHSKLHGRDIQVNIAKPPTSSNNRRNNNRDNGERRGDVRDHGERGGNVPEIDGSKTMEDCSLFRMVILHCTVYATISRDTPPRSPRESNSFFKLVMPIYSCQQRIVLGKHRSRSQLTRVHPM